jgi:hypothetical protein
LQPDQFWRLTLVELSLVLDAQADRDEALDMRAVLAGWVSATMQRSKTIPSFGILWKRMRTGDVAQKLSPEDAAREAERHRKLVELLAPEQSAPKEKA